MKLPAPYIDSIFCIIPVIVFLMFLGNMNAAVSPETTLPLVDLSKIDSGTGIGLSSREFLVVTLAKGRGDNVEIFVKDKKTGPEGLVKAIRDENPVEVTLRVDKSVTHGRVMEVINTCMENGVQHVSYACEETGTK